MTDGNETGRRLEIGERAACPSCGRRSVVPVVFGMPAGDLMEAGRRGDVVIGGCVILPGLDPTVACTRCGWSDAPAGPVDAEADQA